MPEFAGDKKVGESILSRPEKAFRAWGVPKIPRWLETYHLTLTTVLWSGLNILWGYLGRSNLNWLWLVSLMIVLQYVTDLFDGAIGRERNTGLVKWGFYMDHFLDYVFLCSLVMAGYLVAPPDLAAWYMALLIIVGCFMVNSFLAFACTNKFEIYHYGFGPTEMRAVFIIINIIIIYTGTAHFRYTVPALVGVCGTALVWQIYRTHRSLWRLDMEAKAQETI